MKKKKEKYLHQELMEFVIWYRYKTGCKDTSDKPSEEIVNLYLTEYLAKGL